MKTTLIVLLIIIFNQIAFSQVGEYDHAVLSCYDESSELPIYERIEAKMNCLIGLKAPSFSAVAIDKEIIDLKKLKGKIVILNFWFTTCSPCLAEMPGLNEIVDKYSGKNVEFISISKDDTVSLQRFLAEREFKFKVIPDNTEIYNDIFLLTCGYPTTIIIDKTGIIRYAAAGGLTGKKAIKDIQEKLNPVLDELLAD